MLRRLVQSATDRAVSHWLFSPAVRERLGRQEFFYNAFKALRFNRISGDYAEFGSFGGNTFALAYRESRRHGHRLKLWAFDSFQGLPSADGNEHPEWREGKMATSLEHFRAVCAERGIPSDAYDVVPGFYEDTLARADEPRDIALAYVDCDLYSSTTTVLEFLRPRLKQGMIVAFDDYFCWSASQPAGERRAHDEFDAAYPRWRWLPYMQFGWHGMSFVVEDQELREAATVEGLPT